MLWQPSLPEKYTAMTDEQLAGAIAARRAELGDDLVILGHHYQQDDVVRFADFTGDSFKLSRLAAEQVEKAGARYVIFCGVHFMAESADILTPDEVQVILPDLSAGCSMADMADHDQTLDCWEQLQANFGGSNTRIIPVCYMNSSAAIKAFVGEHGGAVCTSSNCDRVFEWAFAGGTEPKAADEEIKILFLPDQHLGRNTAAAMGIHPYDQTCIWDPTTTDALGGNQPADLERSRVILWQGHCSVHKLFRPEHVDQIRQEWPGVKVIVHPECAYEVVQKADYNGSTERIRQAIENAEPGSRWAIGTEVHMVNRLANQAAERGVEVRMLSGCQCLCTTMYRIDPPHLLYTLDQLAEGNVVNQISVDPATRHWATVALDRMLDLVGDNQLAGQPTPA